jgi:hypothetical protein
MAEAAETVLAEQVTASTGNELLIPEQQDDDPISLRQAQDN